MTSISCGFTLDGQRLSSGKFMIFLAVFYTDIIKQSGKSRIGISLFMLILFDQMAKVIGRGGESSRIDLASDPFLKTASQVNI